MPMMPIEQDQDFGPAEDLFFMAASYAKLWAGERRVAIPEEQGRRADDAGRPGWRLAEEIEGRSMSETRKK